MQKLKNRNFRGFHNTAKSLAWDLLKLRARLFANIATRRYIKNNQPPQKIHIGCGNRLFTGWLNCDLKNADINIDFASGKLPFPSEYFESICSQHFIEHLQLKKELQPLLLEAHRCLKNNGEIWISTPDLEKICNYYIMDQGKRLPETNIDDYPPVHIINTLFIQEGEHKNLFDFELLKSALIKAGFTDIKKKQEKDLLQRYPEIPIRDDDYQTLYVTARKIKNK